MAHDENETFLAGNEGVPVGKEEGRHMEVLLLLAFMVGWIVLQAFVLPRFGVST